MIVVINTTPIVVTMCVYPHICICIYILYNMYLLHLFVAVAVASGMHVPWRAARAGTAPLP